MSKQLNVDLRFNADVSAAKAQLQSLQTSINQLTAGMAAQGAQLGITPKIQEAQQAAVQLKTALSQSMNIETGKFDLSKFNSSLKSMNTDLSKLKTQLVNLGPSGQQTFMTLAQSIMTAEIPTKRISASLAALGTTLKNTAKWQLSSSMLHGFMSAVQTSYRYAQDLNTSLNNIRIVTGESAEAMDKFAARANKAAKALSASTLDYTNAALIFYQQGLQGKQVEERAEITLKMANVSRQSAEIVSDQLTAVWNNFANGTDTLESFADKMVALGAATASSSDEIAGGLEKFAAVGETIGLSFDYAAAALATITSNTRQSEEVVGTALKTIFARIQGLKLGETLEDGTTLNKYSQALETVGIHIYNANGGLKNMDTILDETAVKWNTLTEDQQAALAQTVAGVRQYTQFIALMDNWESKGAGDKDSMKANLETISESSGALQEQADLYAESWEAANKRVKAAAEEVYMDLLDDDFFIDLTNGLADFLGLLDNLLDSMGGAKGLLTGLSSILLNMFAGSAAKGLENMVYNFKSFVGLTQKEAVNIKQQAFSLASNINTSTGTNQNTPIQLATTTGMQNQLQLEQDLLNIKDKLTEAEQLQAKYIIEQNNAYSQQAVQVAQQLEMQKERTRLASQDMREAGLAHWDTRTVEEKFSVIKKDIGLNEEIAAELERVNQEFLKAPTAGAEQYVKKIEGLIEKSRSRGMGETATYLEKKIKTNVGKEGVEPSYRTAGGLEAQARADKNITDNIRIKQQQDIENKTRNIFSIGRGRNKEQIVDDKTIEKTTKSMTALIQKEQELDKTNKGVAENTKKSSDAIKNLGSTTRSWSQTMVGMAQSAMSLSFAINSLNSLKTTWADETIGTGEKLLQTFMSLGMAIPMLVNGVNSLKTSFLGANSVMLINEIIETRSMQRKIEAASVESILAIAKTATTDAEKAKAIATAFGLGVEEANQLLTKEGILLQGEDLVLKVKELVAQKLLNLETSKGVMAKGAYTIATTVQTIAQALFNAQLSITASLIIGLVAIIGLLALGIWGITKAWQNYQANTPEGQLKATKEEAKSLNEQLNETRKAAEDLKSEFDDYNQITEKLAKCKKGTQEWTEALKENNDKVLELMEQYPELSAMTQEINGKIESAVSIGADGELIIADWAYDRLYRAVARSGAISSIAANYGQQEVNDKEIKALENKIEKTPGATYTWKEQTTKITGSQRRKGNYTTSEDTRTGAEKRNGKKYTPTYTVTNTGTVSSEKLNEQAKLLIDTYGSSADKHIDEAIKNLDLKGNTTQVSDTIENLINSNMDLRKAVEENTASEKLKNAATAGELMSGYTNYDKSEYKGHINQLVGETLSIEDNQERIDYYKDQITNNSSKENAWKDYIELAGMTEENGYSNLTLGKVTNDEIKYTYIDENDTKQEKVISTGKVAKTLAAEEQYDISAEYGKHIADYMSTFTSQNQADMFSSLISQDANFLSQETLDLSDAKIKNIAESFKLTTENAEDLGPILKKAGVIAEDVELEKLTPEQLKKINKEIADTTTKIVKQKQAFETNKATYQQFVKTLQDANSSSEDLDKAAKGLSKNLGEVFGLENLKVDPKVLKENAGLIQDFFNNTSEDAGAKLQEALASEIQAATVQDAKIDIIANVEGENAKQQVSDILDSISGQILENDFKVGVEIDPESNAKFFESCNALIAAAGWTKEEAQKNFKDMGFDVKLKDVDVEKKTKTNYSYYKLDPEATEKAGGVPQFEKKPTNIPVETTQSGGAFALETITPIGSGGGNVDKINDKIGSTVTSPTTGTINPDGGGDKKNKKENTEPIKKVRPIHESEWSRTAEEVDEYHEINKLIEKMQAEYDRLTAAKERAFGANILKAIDQEIAHYNKYIPVLQNKLSKALENLSKYRDKLISKGAIFNADGVLTNEAELRAKYDSLQNTYLTNKQAFDTYKTTTEAQIKELEDANDKGKNTEQIRTLKQSIVDREGDLEWQKLEADWWGEQLDKWIGEYDEAFELSITLPDEIAEAERAKVEAYLEDLNTRVELRLEFNAKSLEIVEYYLSKIESGFYKAAEGIAFMSEKTDLLKDKLWLADKYVNDVMWDYNNGIGNIPWDDVLKAAEQSGDEILDILTTLQQQDVDMMEYYGNALNNAAEQFDRYDAFFSSTLDSLDNYRSMMTLLRKETDYKGIWSILQSQYDVAKDQMYSKKQYYEQLKEQENWALEQYKAVQGSGTKQEQLLKENYLAAKEITDQAYASYLESLQAMGDKANEILENSLKRMRDTLDKELAKDIFGNNSIYSSLSDVVNQIDRLSASQEEYLTDTNKVYETNKLIRQTQQAMDKTTNTQAKRQYNDYIKYLEKLQDGAKLSAFELSIAQADFELLQAKIALQEAQEAKDTVRLTRDAEGNFGYVYTANADKIAEAEQKVADAENKRYNIGLEGAKKYESLYVQTQQEMMDELERINEAYRNGEIKTEADWQAQLQDAKEHYYGLLTQYDNLYHIAYDTLVENSYENQADYMLMGIGDVENYSKHVDRYIADAKQAFGDYGTRTKEVADETNGKLGELKTGTDKVTTASQLLRQEIEDNLLDAMGDTYKAAQSITTAYGEQRDELLNNLIPATERFLKNLMAIQKYGIYGHNTENYAQELIEMAGAGTDLNSAISREVLQLRWEKMGGMDNNNYSQIIADLDPNDPEYAAKKAAYTAMRNYKIEQMGPGLLLTQHIAGGGTLEDAWGSELVEMFKDTNILQKTDFKYLMDNWLNAGGNETDAFYKFLENEREQKKKVFNLDDNGNVQDVAVATDTTEVIADQVNINNKEEIEKEVLSKFYDANTVKRLINEKSKKADYEGAGSEEFKILAKYVGVNEAQHLLNKIQAQNNAKLLSSYDTGGYTGAWGPEGKLAMLHEKELVLNTDDTKNFLAGINILREISSILDRNALLAGLGLMGVEASYLSNEADKVLQQEVTIHADFPNVTDHNEIEIAIDNLINAASQHAFKV